MPRVPDRFPQSHKKNLKKDFPYFRRLWNTMVVSLLAASLFPLAFIGGGMYYYAVSILKDKTLATLRMEIIDHKEAIDQFLAERTRDLQLLCSNLDIEPLTAPGALDQVFRSLREALPCFTDLGIIDEQGRHLAYVGPYDLISKNYKDEEWFKSVMANGFFVSDVYLGFRDEPHFIIAVTKADEAGVWVLRATVDTAYFDEVVSKMGGMKGGEAFLVNKEGVFQANPKRADQLMSQSPLKAVAPFKGVKVEEDAGRVQMMVWLNRAPWLLVGQFECDEIYEPLYRLRHLGLYVFVLGGVLILLTVLFCTNHLVSALERKRKSIRFLDHQLRQTSMATSAVQIASGLIREINDRLSNIDLVVRWIRDLLNRDLSQRENRNEIRESLNQIASEVMLTRMTADKFIKSTRRDLPVIREIEINGVLDDILDLLDRELHFKKITVERDYQDTLPRFRSDSSQVRQVFQNLILNAVTAIKGEGRIVLTTRAGDKAVTVTVADNGPGILREHLGRIFDPLFTTNPESTGLGLSICAEILQRLGGRISVSSEPGKGSSFVVELPLEFRSPGS